MLAWECPPGVGFSFCPDGSDRLGWTDEKTAVHSADFLAGVVDRHPHLHGRRFFVFGASYAGIYIPMLAEEILKRGPTYPLELVGIGCGNSVVGHFPNASGLPASHDLVRRSSFQILSLHNACSQSTIATWSPRF